MVCFKFKVSFNRKTSVSLVSAWVMINVNKSGRFPKRDRHINPGK